MPKSLWILAAGAAVLLLLLAADPLGIFDAGPGDRGGDAALVDDLLDADPRLQGRGAGAAEPTGPTSFEGDPVGVLDVRLGDGVLTGAVTGAGRPLPLARVRPVLPPPFTGLAVRTGEDGRYEIRGLPLDRHELRVSKDGWVARTVVAPPLAAASEGEEAPAPGAAPGAEAEVEPVDLRRRTANTNALVVVARDVYGRPVPGAKVLASTLPWDIHMTIGPKHAGAKDVNHRSGTTDADGRCRLTALPPDRYNVVATAPGYRTTGVDRVVVAADVTRTVRIELRPGAALHGRVTNMDGEPVAGALVGALHMGTFTSSLSAHTDGDGRFTLDDLRKGTYMVFAYHDDWGQAQGQGTAPGRGTTIKLPGAGTLEGTVTQPDGTPVPTGTIRPYPVMSYDFGYLYSRVHELDAQDGTFSIKLPIGPYKVRVQTPGGAVSKDVDAKIAAGETTTVAIELPQTGVVRGVVVDEGGEHVAGAEVYVRRGGFPPTKSRERYARTDDEGAFEIAGLGLEQVRLHVSHPAHADTVLEATAAPRDQAVEHTVTMPAGAVVEGRVLDPEGRPVANEQVTLYQNWFEAETAFTDGGGGFRFEGVPAGTWQVQTGVFEQGAQGMRREVEVPAQGTVAVAFDMQAATGTVTGTVRVGETPVAGATVSIVDARGAGATVTTTTDASGAFAADGVRPGSFRVRVATPDERSTLAFGSFEEGQATAAVTIEMGTCGVKGRVVDPNGQPVPNAWLSVEAVPAPDDWSKVKAQRSTDAEGRFEAGGLEPGRYLVRVNSSAHAQLVTDPFTVAVDGVADLGTLTLESPVQLTGRVTDDTGAPVENATVSLVDEAGRTVFLFSMSTTGSDGRYIVQGLNPGRYRVKFEAPGYSPFEAPVEIGTGGGTKDGTLTRGGRVEVRVTNEGGYPVEGAHVTLLDEAGREVSKTLSLVNLFEGTRSQTGSDGWVRIPDLAAGTYRVRVEAEGLVADAAPSVVVRPGQATVQEVPLRKP